MLFKQINPKKILLINTFGIGDVLFTTPFISNLKSQLPNVQIDYIVSKRAFELMQNYQKINKVYLYERDEFYAVYKKSKLDFIKKINSLLKEIKHENYDVLFDFSLNSSMSFLSWLTRIPVRIGFNYKNRSPFLTHKFELKGYEGKHVAEHYLDLLEPLGLKKESRSLELNNSSQDKQWADNFFKNNKVSAQRKVIGIFPGGGASWGKSAQLKRWPVDEYHKLIDKIIEKYNAQIILMGDQLEEQMCSKILTSFPTIIKAIGQTTVGQLTAILERCDLAVVNDGGPLHLAVASGTKTVSIFGPVDPYVYGPFGDFKKHRVVTKNLACQPCYRRFRMSDCQHLSCLQKLDVQQVFLKVTELLS